MYYNIKPKVPQRVVIIMCFHPFKFTQWLQFSIKLNFIFFKTSNTIWTKTNLLECTFDISNNYK